jgi:hypothetical protein
MIAGIFHQGSGLGNQLHRYVAARVLALDKGLEFGMAAPELFKGQSFMSLDMGRPLDLDVSYPVFNEKKVIENGVDIRSYDPEINFVKDNTIIEGEFQDIRYFGHRLNGINKWLHVKPLEVPLDVCVIGFRGGEYALYPDLFLTKDYWDKAVEEMLKINPQMKFEVHTDDHKTASYFFPNYKIIENPQLSHSQHANMGLNWRTMRYAKYAIIANSSFYILPRLLRHELTPLGDDDNNIYAVTIAPRYWARRNKGMWALPANYYPSFLYL